MHIMTINEKRGHTFKREGNGKVLREENKEIKLHFQNSTEEIIQTESIVFILEENWNCNIIAVSKPYNMHSMDDSVSRNPIWLLC